MSSSRQRQAKRNKPERTPAIWRGGEAQKPQQVEHGVRNEFGLSWRFLSAIIVISLVIVLVVFFASDIFYVRTISVAGTNYLSESEVFRFTNIAETHIFWVDPAKVRDNLLEASPVISDARVRVSWPPNMVRIVIEEREPAIIWVQGGVSALVDLQGRILRYPPEGEPLPDLLRVVSDNMLEGPPGVDAPIPPDAVNGALQLRNLLAGVQVLRYNPVTGLGFREAGGWDVWLGVGTNMLNKLRVYDALVADLQARGITPYEVNVSNPAATYYCANIEGC